MKKIPTLFKRDFKDHKVVSITDEITPGCEEALRDGLATIKWDGAACALIDGELYRRYDAKPGRKIPQGAIPCSGPDPVTGHHPHWVKCDPEKPDDRWFLAALENSSGIRKPKDGSYEAVGPHFQGNPYGFGWDVLIRHGNAPVGIERTFEGIRKYLEEYPVEGLVFWLGSGEDFHPVCKIKRTDFGLPWPVPDKTESSAVKRIESISLEHDDAAGVFVLAWTEEGRPQVEEYEDDEPELALAHFRKLWKEQSS